MKAKKKPLRGSYTRLQSGLEELGLTKEGLRYWPDQDIQS